MSVIDILPVDAERCDVEEDCDHPRPTRAWIRRFEMPMTTGRVSEAMSPAYEPAKSAMATKVSQNLVNGHCQLL